MKYILSRIIDFVKLTQYRAAGGKVKEERLDRIFNEIKDFSIKSEAWKKRRQIRIGLAESKTGDYLVELFYNPATHKFSLEFPTLSDDPFYEIPRDFLPLIKQVLDDVLWAEGKYIPIPDKTS